MLVIRVNSQYCLLSVVGALGEDSRLGNLVLELIGWPRVQLEPNNQKHMMHQRGGCLPGALLLYYQSQL